MTTYTVYFRTEHQWGTQEFEANTPEQALAIARQFATEDYDRLDLDYYDQCRNAVSEIEVCDAEGNPLATWYDDDMQLRLAAYDLLETAEKVVARLECGDLAQAVRELAAVVAMVKGRGAP